MMLLGAVLVVFSLLLFLLLLLLLVMNRFNQAIMSTVSYIVYGSVCQKEPLLIMLIEFCYKYNKMFRCPKFMVVT